MDRENGDGDIEGGGADDGGFRSSIGRKYRPVLANDRAVLEMSSIDQGSSSSASAFPDQNPNLRKVNTSVNGSSDAKEENLSHEQKPNGSRQQESKLELFGFDSLVNILGLKSMTGEHVTQPSSPRDGEDISITAGLPKPAAPKLGTLMGVFIPCIQSILGIIYYIRFSWIVGMAGIGETLLLVSLCGTCTFLTSISLSAIATNGAMKGGGPYYLIGRALGPEVGVSIGLCFFLGNAVAGALYVLGAVETFLKAVPSAGIFRETVTQVNGTAIAQPIESPSSHDLQIYGIVLTILLCFIVFGGVKMINRVAPAFLIPVLFSVVCIFLGIFLAGKDHPSEGITGLSSETFKENWSADYQKTNDAGIPETDGSVTWNFNSLVGLFFPAVTGIMAGSNRSSSLRDTQQSIPVGTLAATLTTTSLYLVSLMLFGAVATREKLLTDSLIYKYVSIKGKAGDWGDGFKSAYFQLALRSLRSLGASQVHPKNWYPIPLVFCRPWGKLPENVPCHPKLADFANCMKKKGRGMSIFVSILDGDYHECAEDAKTACKQLSTYIDYKNCEGVAEIVVAPNMSEGFRGIIQTMGLGNLKPNIVVMRYPEIWRRENLIEIPATFVGIINDCIVANKAVVIVKGLDEWPNEYQRQYGTIDLYWIVRDGGLMLLLSQLLLTKESFENCKIQVFCIAEEDADAEGLKADVKKFLYDLRMQAEVFVITMKWDAQMDGGGSPAQDESMDAFTSAQQRIDDYLTQMKATAKREGTPLMADGKPVVVNEKQVEKFLYTTLKLNSTILRYSRMAAVVLVSLPPPPVSHPAYFYMEYMDLLLEKIPRILIVRGYRRDVVTLFT
ncbi:Cation-chloride cotransporter 1 [Glycine soja]